MNNKKNIFLLIVLVIFLTTHLSAQDNSGVNFTLLPGSNIYSRIFLFFFPISEHYEIYLSLQPDFFNLEILITQKNINNEPLTPPYFETDLSFVIKNIPYNTSGTFTLPVTMKCNQKYISNKKAIFTIYFKENILIVKGAFSDLFIKDITENNYFKKRLKWRFPIYFDLRIQLEKNLTDEMTH